MTSSLLFLLSFLSSLFFTSVHTPSQVSFTIGGDVMLDRLVRSTYPNEKLSQVFEKLRPQIFSNVDASLINLEGPISSEPLPRESDFYSLIFNFPPQTPSALKSLGVTGVSLANNHTDNQGKLGLATTIDILNKANIKVIGGPNPSDTFQIATFSGSLLKLVVIGTNSLRGSPDITALIRQLKSDPNQRVLIFPHWGNEYQATHSRYQSDQAYAWINAGADVVIGSHPHVIQDAEVYKGKPIIYSLGNLVFDQTFSKETQQGLVVTGTFTPTGLQLSLLPIQIINFQPQAMLSPQKDVILSNFTKTLGASLFFPK